MKTYTSRSRFDESRRFTGVYQQMGRVTLDADWNEEVQIRTQDVRRRSADLAEGSPDDGFRIDDLELLDAIPSTAGWTATASQDERRISRELTLDRRDPVSLPTVLRSRGNITLSRSLPSPISLTAWKLASGSTVALRTLVLRFRIDRDATDEEKALIQWKLVNSQGDVLLFPLDTAPVRSSREEQWTRLEIDVADIPGTELVSWGFEGLPPRARLWIDALYGRANDMSATDFVIHGGDGTHPGAGRLFVDGLRAWLPSDLRYTQQPDLLDPPALSALPADGSRMQVVYLDLWEQSVTFRDDPYLAEPALEGQDTTTRLRLRSQVKIKEVSSKSAWSLDASTSTTRLSTNVSGNEGRPNRKVFADRIAGQTDKGLITENSAVQEGYRGSGNRHVRVEILRQPAGGGSSVPAVLWSRENGSFCLPLSEPAVAGSGWVRLDPADAAQLRVGDLVVLEDRYSRSHADGSRPPTLRRVQQVDPVDGTIRFYSVGALLSTTPTLDVGGTVPWSSALSDAPLLRRWDGADAAVDRARYLLADGITFSLDGSDFRSGEYWSFTTRIVASDGAARGEVESLKSAPVAGPVHRRVALGTISVDAAGTRVFADLRPRFLPLVHVRQRLIELDQTPKDLGTFTVVVGDGQISFGDIDQDRTEGITAEEAIQAAVARVRESGGTIYIRRGNYQLERPVILQGLSRVRILGDGDATELVTAAAGGVFYVDNCGEQGVVSIEQLRLIERPGETVAIGDAAAQPAAEAEPVMPKSEAPAEAILQPTSANKKVVALTSSDLHADQPSFIERVGQTWANLGPGEGRISARIVASITELSILQRNNPGTTLEKLPEAQPYLQLLQRLPHGVVTVADSHQIRLQHCALRSETDAPGAAAVLITGTCSDVAVTGNRMEAATGVTLVPLAPFLLDETLISSPLAGLFLDSVRIEDNGMQPLGEAWHGVYVADGRLEGVRVCNNRIEGFVVGIALDDREEYAAAEANDRLLVFDNEIRDCLVIGISVHGDGMDIADNEIRMAAMESPPALQAAIQVIGQGVRVRGNWIGVPASPATAFGVYAGIIIGDGLDDGGDSGRAVYDVELNDNRIEGAGSDDESAIGVLIGGPQPIYDVRVRGNVIRDLGDAAVRTAGSGGWTGRIRIEDNRIENVGLGAVPDSVIAEDLSPFAASASAVLPLGDLSLPNLLKTVTTLSTPDRVAALDAVLRWAERYTLRGAILLVQVEQGEVVGNRLSGVGRATAPEGKGELDDEVRVAGIALAGGRDCLVENNSIHDVRAPRSSDASEEAVEEGKPEVLGVLEELLPLGTGALRRSGLYAVALHARAELLKFSRDTSGRALQGRRTYGPLDALINGLREVGDPSGTLLTPLEEDVPAMRGAMGKDAHTSAAHRVRASVSRVAADAAFSAEGRAAWELAVMVDAATTKTTKEVETALATLETRLGSFLNTTDGTPLKTDISRYRVQVAAALAPRIAADPTATLSSPSIHFTALYDLIDKLGQYAIVKDLEARSRAMSIGSLGGARALQVRGLVASAQKEVAALQTQVSGSQLLAAQRVVDQLVGVLSKAKAPVTNELQRSFQAVRSLGPRVDSSTLQRFNAQLAAVMTWVETGTAPATTAESEQWTARMRTVAMYVGSLERMVVEAGGGGAAADRSMRMLTAGLGQLDAMLRGAHPDMADQSARAIAEAQAAAQAATLIGEAQTLSDRSKHLNAVGGLLARIRAGADAVFFSVPEQTATSAEVGARQVAALASLLADPEIPGNTVVDAITQHYPVAWRNLGASGTQTTTMRKALDAAKKGLIHAGINANKSRARLCAELEDVITSAFTRSPEESMVEAVGLLVQSLQDLLKDPDGPVISRLTARADLLSPSVVTELATAISEERGFPALATVLLRVARGDLPGLQPDQSPVFSEDLWPADGVAVLGVESSARIAGNRVLDAVNGITALGPGQHALGELLLDSELQLELIDNQLQACAISALQVRTGVKSAVTVSRNQVSRCAGLAAAGPDDHAQAVAWLSGQGELVVQGNHFNENGNNHNKAMLHELLVDWRGDIVIAGNTLRHSGGGAGGAGMVVLPELGVNAALVARLCRSAFLAVEPPPSQPSEQSSSVNQAFDRLTGRSTGETDVFRFGALKQRVSPVAPSHRMINTTLPVRRDVSQARSVATRYLEQSSLAKSPLIRFLQPIRPISLQRLPIRAQRSVHIEGNDVVANGPALLVLGGGADVVSTSISGNAFCTEGASGAVYLRYLDATVFSGNRCQSPRQTNVVVVRAQRAPVTLSGNVLLGAEPVMAPPPARPPADTRPRSPTLFLPVSGGGSLSLKVPATSLLTTLEQRRKTSNQALSSLMEDLALGGSTSTATEALTLGGSLTAPTTTTSRLTSGLTTFSTVKKLYTGALTDRTERSTVLLQTVTNALTERGGTSESIKSIVKERVEQTGSVEGALKQLHAEVTGVDPDAPSAYESLKRASLLHQVLADWVEGRLEEDEDDAEQEAPPPPPPRPEHCSLVVIGGTRVAAVANAATASILVLEANAHVELNP